MNKRRNIYKGMNRRRNYLGKVMILGTIIVCILGGTIFIKNFNFDNTISKIKDFSKFMTKDSSKIEEFEYEDVAEVNSNNENNIESKDSTVANEDIKVATITNWDMYSIQIAAINNEEELKQIEETLSKSNIPFSVIEIDGVKKVQTYVSLNEDECRKNLEEVKSQFTDAFVTKLEVPLVRLDYTDKYAYVEEICKELNNLINNFKQESEFWIKNNEIVDIEEYKNIKEDRDNILTNIEKQGKKIDYDGMKAFKENLLNYATSMKEKSEESLKMVEDKNYHIAKSLFMSGMQGYYSFINSIKSI